MSNVAMKSPPVIALVRELDRVGLAVLAAHSAEGDRIAVTVDGWPDTITYHGTRAVAVLREYPQGYARTEAGNAEICGALETAGVVAREGSVSADAPLIVTRHLALVTYLRETGIAPPDAIVVDERGPQEYPLLTGRHVYGVLPLHLAALCASITHVPLRLPAALDVRGRELTIEEVRQYAGAPETYVVQRVARVALPHSKETHP